MKTLAQVSSGPAVPTPAVKRAAPTPENESPGRSEFAPGAPRDKVTLSSPPSVAALLYARPSASAAGTQPTFGQLKDMVLRTLREQGLATEIATGDGTTAQLSDLTPDQAKALVADDGYWGVAKTSQRIADLAMGLAGNDPTKAESVLQALDKGFEQARQAFGGKLPEISEKTIAAVHEKIQAWGATATAATTTS